MKINTLLVALILILTFSGCFTAKKIRKITNVAKLAPLQATNSETDFKVTFEEQDSLPNINQLAEVSKNKDYVMVVPFATWHKRDYKCIVGANFFKNSVEGNIRSAINFALDSLAISDLQHVYELKLKISEIGFEYQYYNKGGMAGIPPALSFTWKSEFCLGTKMTMKLDYDLIENGKSLTKGEIERIESIDTISKYTPIPLYNRRGGEIGPNMNPEYDNLNGGIYPLLLKEMSIGTISFNKNIYSISLDLIENRLRKYLK